MSKWLDAFGTIATQFQIGIGGTGLRRLRFKNGFNGDLEWNPTANRVLTLPDATGTLFCYQQAAFEAGGGISYAIVGTRDDGTIDPFLLGGGRLLQVPVTNIYQSYASSTAVIPSDDTIPQNTEGTQVLTATITPVSATSKLHITALVHGAFSGANALAVAMFRNSSGNAIAAQSFNTDSGNVLAMLKANATTGTTSAITITVRAGLSAAGTVYFNGNTTNRIYGGARFSYLEVLEIE